MVKLFVIVRRVFFCHTVNQGFCPVSTHPKVLYCSVERRYVTCFRPTITQTYWHAQVDNFVGSQTLFDFGSVETRKNASLLFLCNLSHITFFNFLFKFPCREGTCNFASSTRKLFTLFLLFLILIQLQRRPLKIFVCYLFSLQSQLNFEFVATCTHCYRPNSPQGLLPNL